MLGGPGLLITPTAPAALRDSTHWPRWKRTEVLCKHLDGNKGFFKILFIFLSKRFIFLLCGGRASTVFFLPSVLFFSSPQYVMEDDNILFIFNLIILYTLFNAIYKWAYDLYHDLLFSTIITRFCCASFITRSLLVLFIKSSS